MRADMLEKDALRCIDREADDAVDLNSDKSIDIEKEVNVVAQSLKSSSFCDTMRTLSPYQRSLKEQIKDQMVCYIDLLRPGPPPSRTDDELKTQVSRRLA